MTKVNVPCAKFVTSLAPPCGPIYQQCFETRCYLGGFCAYLTHTCRYHRIFANVAEMSKSSTFCLTKPHRRQTKSHLSCTVSMFFSQFLDYNVNKLISEAVLVWFIPHGALTTAQRNWRIRHAFMDGATRISVYHRWVFEGVERLIGDIFLIRHVSFLRPIHNFVHNCSDNSDIVCDALRCREKKPLILWSTLMGLLTVIT